MPISQITGASIQDGSIVVADLGITTFNTGTGNTLTLQANSATGLVISVTGNTAIANSLSFSSTGARITGDFSNATIANRVLFQTSTANNNTAIQSIPNGTAVVSQFSAFNNSDPTNASLIGIRSSDTEGRLEASRSGSGSFLPLTMYTGGSERLRIDTSGNVGIGTNSPTSRLQVNGTATATYFDVPSGSGYNSFQMGADGTGTWYVYDKTNAAYRLNISNSGNVGIGTTSPSQKLHVAAGTILSSNTAGTTATVSIAGNGSTTGTSDFSLQQGTSSEAYVFNRANSFLVLGTNNTERMRIDSSGNVGIGVTTPTHKLAIGYSNADSSNKVAIGNIASYQGLLDFNNSNEVFTIENTTDYSIGGIAFKVNGSNRGFFDINGNFQFNSGYGSVSTAYGCRAWVNFNGTGTVAIRASGNVSSITDNGSGSYTVNFANSMPDANYSALVNSSYSDTDNGMITAIFASTATPVAPTTSGFRFTTARRSDGVNQDSVYFTATVFR